MNIPRLALLIGTMTLLLGHEQASAAESARLIRTRAASGLPSRHHHHLHRAYLVEGEPALRSASALVWDETSSAVLLSRHADVANPIASITKLMTAMVVLEAGQPLDEPITITADDVNLAKPNASRLPVGATLNRGDLLHLALMASENRAANALARHYPGGRDACVAAMNAKARELGMSNTRFLEPTGLSSSNVASPQDLSRLVMAASQNPTIQADSTASSYTVSIGGRLMEFHTTDRLVSSSSWDIVVQKTGYISEAGRCLVMKALIQGRAIVIVLLDSKGTQTRIADAQRIRKWMQSRLKETVSHS
jgi:D-alanyl-D-alanine endopeptidase (penicillin-binding protein 7)